MKNRIYNQLSESYNELFFLLLNHFVSNCNTYDSEYAVFYPSFGVKEREPCDFLILGQAVKGWSSNFYSQDEKIDVKNQLVDCIYQSNKFYEPDNHNPLDWVNVRWTKSTFNEEVEGKIDKKDFYLMSGDYFTYRSFFWKVTYRLINNYFGYDKSSWEWSKKMVYSNLYKIAPMDKNPIYEEKKLQEDYCIRLLKKELEELNPKYCIVMTNLEWWKPFQKGLNTKVLTIDNNLYEVISFEEFNNTKIIVTTRPFIGDADVHVKQILTLIKN